MIGRRAFANKLIKDSNVDIRHRLAKILASTSLSSSSSSSSNVTSPINSKHFDPNSQQAPSSSSQLSLTLTSHCSSTPNGTFILKSVSTDHHESTINYYCDIPISDVVDPIDYEEYIEKNVERLSTGSMLCSILLFPHDDLVVEQYLPTTRRILESSSPEFNNIQISDDPFIQCISACDLKSLIVVKRYQRYSLDFILERESLFKELRREEYEVDLVYSISNSDEKFLKTRSPSIHTINTFYSCSSTSTQNTPRPRSLVSQASTLGPPLASDEEVFIDGDDVYDEFDRSKTPLAEDYKFSSRDSETISLQSIRSSHKGGSYSNVANSNQSVDQSCDMTQPQEIGEIDSQKLLEKNYDNFFDDVDWSSKTKNEENYPIFCLYNLQPSKEMIESRPRVSPPSDVKRYRFFLKFLSLKMHLQIEPIFASIAIYDAKAKKKITENFYFDSNSEPMKQLLSKHILFQDISTLSKMALFNVSQLTSDMYFVIKLEKIFQSDINDLIDVYTRSTTDLEANKMEKLKSNIKNNCDRLGRYRMLLAWTAFPLVDVLLNGSNNNNPGPNNNFVEPAESVMNLVARNNSSSLDSLKRIANECTSNFTRKGSLERQSTTFNPNVSNFSASANSTLDKRNLITTEEMVQAFENFHPVVITSKVFYRYDGGHEKFNDEDLYKFLQDFRRSNLNSKRIRYFPCTLKIDISVVKDESLIKYRLNPELNRLHPYSDDQRSITPVREVFEFSDLLIPNLEPRNMLFIYPKTLNFTCRQNSARNLCIKVQLLNSEEKFSALPVIFGKSSCPEFTNEAYTAIAYHNRNPCYCEEIKLRLPSQITKQTHLLFTFIHVHTKQKNDIPIEEEIGYTWLPLWRDDCLRSGLFSLPIVSEQLTSGYSFLTATDSDALSNLKWYENRKLLFTVQLDCYSSIYAQDSYVDRFFRVTSSFESRISSQLHSSNIYEEFCRVVSGLTQANIPSLVKFLHIIFNRLMMLLVKPPSIFINQEPNASTKTTNASAGTMIKSFQTTVFDTLVQLVNKVQTAMYSDVAEMRAGILSTFVHYQAIFPQPDSEGFVKNLKKFYDGDDDENLSKTKKPTQQALHEEILSQWLLARDSTKDNLHKFSFFFFDMIFKSLCVGLYLDNNSLVSVPRRLRATKCFMTNLTSLVGSIGDHIMEVVCALYSENNDFSGTSPTHSLSQIDVIQDLNLSLAFFIQDLLSVLDRHLAFNLIKLHLAKLNSHPFLYSERIQFPYQNKTESGNNSTHQTSSTKIIEKLFELKIDFLRVICGHEHFVALNLPFGTPLFSALEQQNNNNQNHSSTKFQSSSQNNGFHSTQNNSSKFSLSSSFAKEMLNSDIFSNLIFERIRPYSELTDEYRRQHWLFGLVFCTLLESFTKPKPHLQTRTANLVRSILTQCDWDDRYRNQRVKSRIACLMLPLIGIMIDVIEHLHDSCTKTNPFYSSMKNYQQNQQRKQTKIHTKLHQTSSSSGQFLDSSIAMAIAGSAVNKNNETDNLNFLNSSEISSGSDPSSPMNYRHTLSYQPINKKATHILLICFLWVIGNIDNRLLSRYLQEFSNERFLSFLELLRISTRVFEYQGERMIQKSASKYFRRQSFQKLDDTIRYGSAKRELIRRRDYSQSFGSSSTSDMKVRWKKDTISPNRFSQTLPDSIDFENEIIIKGHLCSLTSRIIVDSINLVLDLFCQRMKSTTKNFLSSSSSTINNHNSINKTKYADDKFVVASALDNLIQLMSLRQCTQVLEIAFDAQRALIHHFPELLFIEGLAEVEFCSELCLLLLKHCASQITAIRWQASASIYLLLRQYYQSNGDYAQIKTQITMSLSQLVGANLTFNETFIKSALNSILRYALNDQTVQSTQFPNQVRELIFNLIMILSDTMQMKEHEQDPEMLLDLMYRVAKGYQNSPELRVTWLQNMAKKHMELGQHVEAAQCKAHAAALISECLHKVSRRAYLPVSCAAFQRVCPNVFEESLKMNHEINIDKSSFFNDNTERQQSNSGKISLAAKLISENGLVSLLEQAAEDLNLSGMFEAVNEVYKLLIPIYEAHHRYSMLAEIHGRLKDVFLKIDKQEGKRVFSTYFRVGFYGSLFGDLNQKEFIYKEPFLTKLPEIANRLESFYANRLGSDRVEVVKDSNPVNTSKLDPNKAYIQITYVEPHFDSWELESRQTCYDRNYNIKRFIYSTPFTMDGRAHGQLYEQMKRKTILSTEHSLPYVKTRVLVVNRQQSSLSPIEVAIEDLQKKTKELSLAIHQEPLDGKILQMVLQGCVGTTVNQGPAEIAFVFLADEPNIPPGHQRPSQQLKEKLRNAFKDFCFRCGEALSKNRELIANEGVFSEYHRELEKNFYRFTDSLAPLMVSTANKRTSNDIKQTLVLLRETYFIGFNNPVSSSTIAATLNHAQNHSSNRTSNNNQLNPSNNSKFSNGIK